MLVANALRECQRTNNPEANKLRFYFIERYFISAPLTACHFRISGLRSNLHYDDQSEFVDTRELSIFRDDTISSVHSVDQLRSRFASCSK